MRSRKLKAFYSSLVVSGNFLFAVSGRNITKVPDMIVNPLKNANGNEVTYLIYTTNRRNV